MKDLDEAIAKLQADIARLEKELDGVSPYIEKMNALKEEALIKKEVYEENITFITQKGVIMLIDEYGKIKSELAQVMGEIQNIDLHIKKLQASIDAQRGNLVILNEQKKRLEAKNKKGAVIPFRKRKSDD